MKRDKRFSPALFIVKEMDDDQRIIEGVATTVNPDRVGDVVEPKGAQYDLPIPFLWQHRSDSPIGHVTRAKVTRDGIEVRVQLAKTDTPGELKNLLDRAWESIKLGLVRGLSIGFRPIESARIADTYAEHYTVWEWLELSAVTIPANAEATIATVKHYDDQHLAAFGRPSPGASGTPVKINPKPKPQEGQVKTTAEQIQDLEATRAAKTARMAEIQQKAAESGVTKDASQKEEFDTLAAEIKSIDAELADLRILDDVMKSAAKPVVTDPKDPTKAASNARDPRTPAHVQVHSEKMEKGIGLARYAMCLAAAKGNVQEALSLAKTHYPQFKPLHDVLALGSPGGNMEKLLEQQMLLIKAAVPAGTTSDATWAGPLVAYNNFAGDFVEFLRPRTIIGQFGDGGRPDLRRIPFNVHIKGQTTGGTGYWVGEGKPKPVTKFDFNDTYHAWNKVAAIAVLTEELIRFSDPSAERLVRDALAAVLIERMDTDFIDPAKAAVANVSPASITNGVTPITGSGGTDGDAVRTDIAALWAAPIAAKLSMRGAVYITTPTIALQLSLMMNALGQREFPDVSMAGGTLLGVPVIVSDYVPAGTFVLAFAPEIYFSDDGQVTIDASREASIQMLDNPTNDPTGATVATAMVSMYQTDSMALRAHRFVTWSKRRAAAVSLVEDVAWGGVAS